MASGTTLIIDGRAVKRTMSAAQRRASLRALAIAIKNSGGVPLFAAKILRSPANIYSWQSGNVRIPMEAIGPIVLVANDPRVTAVVLRPDLEDAFQALKAAMSRQEAADVAGQAEPPQEESKSEVVAA